MIVVTPCSQLVFNEWRGFIPGLFRQTNELSLLQASGFTRGHDLPNVPVIALAMVSSTRSGLPREKVPSDVLG
jgi:hypothetical protein